MSRKGYSSEYEAKKILIKQFGFHNVFKNAISNQGADYLVVGKGELVKCVEVKECHKKKYYPSQKELSQFKRIKEFCNEHMILCEVWVKSPRKPWQIFPIEHFLGEEKKVQPKALVEVGEGN